MSGAASGGSPALRGKVKFSSDNQTDKQGLRRSAGAATPPSLALLLGRNHEAAVPRLAEMLEAAVTSAAGLA